MRLKTVCASISAMYEVHSKKKIKKVSSVLGKKRTDKNREEKEIETDEKSRVG